GGNGGTKENEDVAVPRFTAGSMQRELVFAEIRRHVRRREEAAGEVVRPGVVRALDPSGEMPFGLLAQPCTAMAADVEQRVDRPLLVSRDDDAVVADRAREKVAGAWNLVGAPRADPAVEIETLQLGAIEVGVGVKLSGKGRVHRVARLKARAPSASRQASMI